MDKIKKFFESKIFKIIIYTLGISFVLFFVFQAGMIAGFNKASFGRNWGDNYDKNFGSQRRFQPIMNGGMKEFPNSHGAVGKIIKVELPNIVVLDKDKTEKIIIINDKTDILERKEKVSKDNLTIDKYIVLIGNPNNNGQIEARLIRIIPSPEDMMKDRGLPDNNLPEDFNNKNM